MTEAQLKSSLTRLMNLRDADEYLVYITGDKAPVEQFGTNIAPDVLPYFDELLNKIGHKDKIIMLLHSAGGSLEAPWPLVSLIREYCDELEIVVPHKALSAGTLICLGADKIVMTPYSYLSPIDPQGSFPIGENTKSIQVEDVIGFVDFAKNRVGVADQVSLTEAMRILAAEIPPSVLGSIYRTHSLIRALAGKLLNLHKIKMDKSQVKEVVENLTEKLFSHQHMINRSEGKNSVGLKNLIDFATVDEEKEIRAIYAHFRKAMDLDEPFDPNAILGSDQRKVYPLVRAIIRGTQGNFEYTTKYNIQKLPEGAPQPFVLEISDKGWLRK